MSSISKILGQASIVGASIGAGALLANNTEAFKHFGNPNSTANSRPSDELLRTSELLNERLRFQESTNQSILQTILALNEKIANYEVQLERLKKASSKDDDDDNERSSISAVQNNAQTSNLFELSKILEANQQASQRTLKRRLKKQRETLSQQALARVEEEVAKVESKYRPIVMGISALEAEIAHKQELIQKEAPARVVWLACQNLYEKLKFNTNPEPLINDPSFRLLKKMQESGKSTLASLVVASLPERAVREGVYSEQVLASRFDKVARISRSVATIDENGGGIAKYLLAFVQSLLIIRPEVNLKHDELNRIPYNEMTSLSNHELIERALFCLQYHNLEHALVYAKLLKGQSRVVAHDWIEDAILHMQAKLSIDIIAKNATQIQRELASMTADA